MLFVAGKPDKQALLLNGILQDANVVILCSEAGNFNAELFMEWVQLCLFPYVKERRKTSQSKRAVLLLENCAIHLLTRFKRNILHTIYLYQPSHKTRQDFHNLAIYSLQYIQKERQQLKRRNYKIDIQNRMHTISLMHMVRLHHLVLRKLHLKWLVSGTK
ncbi:MAG: hypothetical protein EZS28_049017 [Streblomastix strix]|uniref:DDE-1 domain-containing protein n=1 Tax=Streblomastix strix TaxID=222440 RepID=A0A5J4TAQ0_9EUKA|nr:MAG: hypothetical protein EZS28_049017 [Streblomastix strix]